MIHIKQVKIDLQLTPYICINNFNRETKTIKLFQENEEYSYDLRVTS